MMELKPDGKCTCEEEHKNVAFVYASQAGTGAACTRSRMMDSITEHAIVSWKKEKRRAFAQGTIARRLDADVRRQVAAYSGLPTQTALMGDGEPFCLK